MTISLSEKVKINGKESIFFEPNLDLKKHLSDLVKSTPLAKNALALIDPYGNFLLARADRFDVSPIHSSIVNVVADYQKFYFD
jgi:cytosine deaminase